MRIFLKINRVAAVTADGFNLVAAVALFLMMLLTSADVVLRFFRHPIPGTYEVVGFLGAIVVSFSLAHTSLARGHIAVDFLIQKLPVAAGKFAERVNSAVCSLLFAVISWQSALYGLDTKSAGEVSMTIQMPVYPFIFGVAIGCGFLSIILCLRFFESFTKASVKES